MLTFVCSDGELRFPKSDVFKQSDIITEMLQGEDGNDIHVPLNIIDCATFLKIVEFMHLNAANPMPRIARPIKSMNMNVNVVQWAAKYIDELSLDQLCKIIFSANYLCIDPLVDLGCAKIAASLRYRTLNEIRQYYNIDLPTDEELPELKKKLAWICDINPSE